MPVMKQAGAVLLLLLFMGLALSAAISRVGNHAVDVWAAQTNRPMSATDAVLQSRQTPAESIEGNGHSGWWGAGLLALGLVIVGAVLFLLRGGSDFLRQWRLLWKRSSNHRGYRSYLPEYPLHYPEAEQVRNVPSVTYLPEVNVDQAVDSHN